MKKIEYFCDVCGNNVEEVDVGKTIQLENPDLYFYRTTTYDVCETCYKKISKLIKDVIEEERLR